MPDDLKCCCGEPQTAGVVHRTDAPCFVIQDDTALLRQALEALEKGETALRFAAIDALKDRLHAR